MTRKTVYILLAAATAGILLLTACNSSRKTVKTEGYQPSDNAPGSQRPTAEGEFEALAASYAGWTDVSIPLKVQISEPKNLSVSATAKMVNGKALSVSLRVFGFEVGSLFADNDSVIVVSKFNSIYCSESLAQITAAYGLTLADIQSVLLGRVFAPGCGALNAKDFKQFNAVINDNSLNLEPKKMPKGLSWTFATALSHDAAPTLRSVTVNADGHNPIVAAYGSAVQSEAGMVAPWVNLVTSLRNMNIDATMTWEMSRAKWNAGLSVTKPRIPAGARRIPASRIMDILKK